MCWWPVVGEPCYLSYQWLVNNASVCFFSPAMQGPRKREKGLDRVRRAAKTLKVINEKGLASGPEGPYVPQRNAKMMAEISC